MFRGQCFSMQVLRARWAWVCHSFDRCPFPGAPSRSRPCRVSGVPNGRPYRAATNLLDDRMNGPFRSLTALILGFRAGATWRPIAHRNAATSRAIAAVTNCAFLPAAISRR